MLPSSTALSSSSSRRGDPSTGSAKRNDRAAPGAVLGADRPAVRLDDASADRQAEPDPAWSRRAGRGRTSRRPAPHPVGQPGPSVRHFDHRPSPRSAPRSRSASPSGVYLIAFSSRFTRTCSISTPSSGTSGRSSGIRTDACRSRRCFSTWFSAAPTTSSIGCHSFCTCDAARLDARHAQQVADEAVEPLGLLQDRLGQLAARLSAEIPRLRARLLAAPVIVASGVRRSWDTELRSRSRSRSASARSFACVRLRRQERPLDHEAV